MKIIRSGLSKASIVSVILGLVLVIWPGISVKLIGYVLGGTAIVYGAVRIIRSLTGKGYTGGGSIVWGVICCLFGGFIWNRFPAMVSFLPFIIGIVVLGSGLVKLQGAFEDRRNGYSWVGALIASIVSIALGILVICRPFSTLTWTLRLIGAVIFVDGAENLIEAWIIRRRMKSQGYLAEEGEDGIIDIVTDDQ